MIQAFIIVLREGFESFLIVAIITAYLKKTLQTGLIPAVYWGLMASVAVSTGLGWLLYQGLNGPLWEAVFGMISAALVAALVFHMWRTAGTLKKEMEQHLYRATGDKTTAAAWLGVFAFTILMISREGMETALLMMQIQSPQIWTGIILGTAAAGSMALLWARFGHLINIKLFLQVTAIFLMLFVVQIIFNSLHEFSEAGLLPRSEAFHAATEPYSADGYYGKWFSFVLVGICAAWLIIAWIKERFCLSGKGAQ